MIEICLKTKQLIRSDFFTCLYIRHFSFYLLGSAPITIKFGFLAFKMYSLGIHFSTSIFYAVFQSPKKISSVHLKTSY